MIRCPLSCRSLKQILAEARSKNGFPSAICSSSSHHKSVPVSHLNPVATVFACSPSVSLGSPRVLRLPSTVNIHTLIDIRVPLYSVIDRNPVVRLLCAFLTCDCVFVQGVSFPPPPPLGDAQHEEDRGHEERRHLLRRVPQSLHPVAAAITHPGSGARVRKQGQTNKSPQGSPCCDALFSQQLVSIISLFLSASFVFLGV